MEKRLYVENVGEWNRNLAKKRFSDRKLKVKVVERGIVLPARQKEIGYAGGVCDNDFNFVAGYVRAETAQNSSGGIVGFTSIRRTPSTALRLLNWMKM